LKILECNLCGNCCVCPYLSKYGYPKEIYLKRDPSVFICTNCGLCDRLCPFEINPSYAIYSVKDMLIKEGKLSEENLSAINSARKFTKTMSCFPFYHLDFKETVFFPGCALISQGSKIVYKIKKWLEERLKEKIGITLHCCGDPMYQNGDTSYLSSFAEKLKDKLEKYGVFRIIFACSNCKKIFKEYLNSFELIHISELIVDGDIKECGKDFILHHPCPNFKIGEIKVSIDKSFGKRAIEIIENPLCCGLGGAANKLDRDVAKRFIGRIKDIAKESAVLTSCMGCKNRFLKNGIKAKHIYEELI
jgi:Fe-S oxidoreductase